jgi:tetratricopeptide (TPR) repeat protein
MNRKLNFTEESLLLEAFLAENSKNWKVAEVIYTQLIAIATKPENQASYYRSRAFNRRTQKKFEAAILDFDNALKIDPYNHDLYLQKAACLSNYAFDAEHSQDVFDQLLKQSWECVNRCKALIGNDSQMYSDLIEQSFLHENFKHVIALAGEAKKICPDPKYHVINHWLVQLACCFLKRPISEYPLELQQMKIGGIWCTVEVESKLMKMLEPNPTDEQSKLIDQAIEIHCNFLNQKIDVPDEFTYKPFHERFADKINRY